MSDTDLAILGAEPQRFDEYETQVRAEYSWVPDEIFRVKRQEILAGFLARKLIFNTPRLQQLFEHQARTNLAGSIENLRQPD
jgi:predicted metal-dependent HD superfamily phosphohydrolase